MVGRARLGDMLPNAVALGRCLRPGGALGVGECAATTCSPEAIGARVELRLLD